MTLSGISMIAPWTGGGGVSRYSPGAKERRYCRKMKIAFIVPQFPALSETFILNQITGLMDRGHHVDIYPIDYRLTDMPKIHPDVIKYSLLERTYYPPTVPTRHAVAICKLIALIVANCYRDRLCGLRLLNAFRRGKKPRLLRLIYLATLILRNGPYDIVHCQFGPLGLKALYLRKLGVLSGRVITSFRGCDVSMYLHECGDDVYKELFKEGDCFLPNCDYFKRRIIKLGCEEEKIIVHRSGIDCEKFFFSPRQRDGDGRTRIVTVGRLVEKKGIEYGIRAVAKVSMVNRNVEYSIIGDGPLRAALQELILALDVNRVVKLLGHRDQREIIEVVGRSHIFIAGSVTAKSGDQDAPVNTLKEAMAMGLPVIATQHGGIPELVEDGVSGFLVPERDADALGDRLAHLIEHPEIWPEMGRAGRRVVEEHYDMKKLNDELVSIYEAILKRDVKRARKHGYIGVC